MGAVSEGSATSSVISQPAPWSWLIWAVKSVSPALKVAFDATVNPSFSAAKSSPARPVSPYGSSLVRAQIVLFLASRFRMA